MTDIREAPAAATGTPWQDRRQIRTTASPDRAWRAWADPAAIQGWFADEAEGGAEPGSVLIHRFPAMGFEIAHEVVESEPGRRLLLRMAFPGRPPVTQEIVVRTESGETVIELVNSGFGAEQWDGQYEGIDSGWRLALAQLRHYLERHWGRRRHVWLSLRPAPMAWDGVARLFREPAGLAQWLAEPEWTGPRMPGDTGTPISVPLRGRRPLTGRVLADSGREVLLSWDDIEGAIELKAFATGPAAMMVGLRVSSWSQAPPSRDELQGWLDGCTDRLAAALG